MKKITEKNYVWKIALAANHVPNFTSFYITAVDFSDALDYALKRVDIENSKKENKGVEITLEGITEELELDN